MINRMIAAKALNLDVNELSFEDYVHLKGIVESTVVARLEDTIREIAFHSMPHIAAKIEPPKINLSLSYADMRKLYNQLDTHVYDGSGEFTPAMAMDDRIDHHLNSSILMVDHAVRAWIKANPRPTSGGISVRWLGELTKDQEELIVVAVNQFGHLIPKGTTVTVLEMASLINLNYNIFDDRTREVVQNLERIAKYQKMPTD